MKWPDDKAEDGGLTVWNAADNDTKRFSPSESSFMINYRVDNLDELLASLKQNSVEIVSGPESHENGGVDAVWPNAQIPLNGRTEER